MTTNFQLPYQVANADIYLNIIALSTTTTPERKTIVRNNQNHLAHESQHETLNKASLHARKNQNTVKRIVGTTLAAALIVSSGITLGAVSSVLNTTINADQASAATFGPGFHGPSIPGVETPHSGFYLTQEGVLADCPEMGIPNPTSPQRPGTVVDGLPGYTTNLNGYQISVPDWSGQSLMVGNWLLAHNMVPGVSDADASAASQAIYRLRGVSEQALAYFYSITGGFVSGAPSWAQISARADQMIAEAQANAGVGNGGATAGNLVITTSQTDPYQGTVTVPAGYHTLVAQKDAVFLDGSTTIAVDPAGAVVPYTARPADTATSYDAGFSALGTRKTLGNVAQVTMYEPSTNPQQRLIGAAGGVEEYQTDIQFGDPVNLKFTVEVTSQVPTTRVVDGKPADTVRLVRPAGSAPVRKYLNGNYAELKVWCQNYAPLSIDPTSERSVNAPSWARKNGDKVYAILDSSPVDPYTRDLSFAFPEISEDAFATNQCGFDIADQKPAVQTMVEPGFSTKHDWGIPNETQVKAYTTKWSTHVVSPAVFPGETQSDVIEAPYTIDANWPQRTGDWIHLPLIGTSYIDPTGKMVESDKAPETAVVAGTVKAVITGPGKDITVDGIPTAEMEGAGTIQWCVDTEALGADVDIFLAGCDRYGVPSESWTQSYPTSVTQATETVVVPGFGQDKIDVSGDFPKDPNIVVTVEPALYAQAMTAEEYKKDPAAARAKFVCTPDNMVWDQEPMVVSGAGTYWSDQRYWSDKAEPNEDPSKDSQTDPKEDPADQPVVPSTDSDKASDAASEDTETDTPNKKSVRGSVGYLKADGSEQVVGYQEQIVGTNKITGERKVYRIALCGAAEETIVFSVPEEPVIPETPTPKPEEPIVPVEPAHQATLPVTGGQEALGLIGLSFILGAAGVTLAIASRRRRISK